MIAMTNALSKKPNFRAPYEATFSHPKDQMAAWLLVVFLLAIGMFVFRRAVLPHGKGESLCFSFGITLVALLVAVAENLLFGWVFLIKLEIDSPLWTFWGLGYILTIIIVFRILPFFALILVAWATYGRFCQSYSPRTVWIAGASLLLLVLDAILSFVGIGPS